MIAYRARGGVTRVGAFDSTKTYVTRELAERQAIRDHLILERFERFVPSESGRQRLQRRRAERPEGPRRH